MKKQCTSIVSTCFALIVWLMYSQDVFVQEGVLPEDDVDNHQQLQVMRKVKISAQFVTAVLKTTTTATMQEDEEGGEGDL
eukprot:m.108929 g.108929  ORF g.108929 m.108929 type:complete len:80 (+) comp12723_c0_seq12:2556-2795(+)